MPLSPSLTICRKSRRILQLRRLLESLHHPLTSHLSTPLGSIPIPSSRKVPPPSLQSLSPSEGRSLGYLFSCLGNISTYNQGRGLSLNLYVHLNRGEVAWRFFRAFGGSLRSNDGGRGNKAPNLRWRVNGEMAERAASFFLQFPSRKTECLTIAAQWKGLEGEEERAGAERSLRLNKEVRSVQFNSEGLVSSWRSLAELVDCRGFIISTRPSRRIRLVIHHRSRRLLESIPPFLRREGLVSAVPRVHGCSPTINGLSRFSWASENRSSLLFIFPRLLKAGGRLKKEKLRLALQSLLFENKEIQLDMRPDTNHLRYRRLEGETFELAVRLGLIERQKSNLRAKIKKAGAPLSPPSLAKLKALEGHSRVLRGGKASLKKTSEINKIREDVRSLLERKGGGS